MERVLGGERGGGGGGDIDGCSTRFMKAPNDINLNHHTH